MDEARTITLNILQRVGLDDLLGAAKGTRENNQEYYHIRRKVKLSLAEKKDLQERGVILQQPNGQIVFNEEKMLEEGDRSFELEGAEVRRFRKFIDTHAELTPAQMDWLEPAMEQLEAKQAGPVAVKATA